MARAFVIHWNKAEALEKVKALRAQGWTVVYEHEDGARAWKNIKENPPNVVVIWLSRLPSHGRETADALKRTKSTRDIPIVFVDGLSEKVNAVKAVVPNAAYTTSDKLMRVLKKFADGIVR